MVGTARKNENSAAACLVNFCCIPPKMVAALLLKPGKATARTWKHPILKAVRLLISYFIMDGRIFKELIDK